VRGTGDARARNVGEERSTAQRARPQIRGSRCCAVGHGGAPAIVGDAAYLEPLGRRRSSPTPFARSSGTQIPMKKRCRHEQARRRRSTRHQRRLRLNPLQSKSNLLLKRLGSRRTTCSSNLARVARPAPSGLPTRAFSHSRRARVCRDARRCN
jgi:hypothetical protein